MRYKRATEQKVRLYDFHGPASRNNYMDKSVKYRGTRL